ncbi:hypothetical protein [Methylobacterium nigriterrae]|uniref:hypothetical protein n=1 Tax=Methylobacterium nigriterrae TaxID=3127512 RepID=UPI003013CFB0
MRREADTRGRLADQERRRALRAEAAQDDVAEIAPRRQQDDAQGANRIVRRIP